jgi:hypothetical protein
MSISSPSSEGGEKYQAPFAWYFDKGVELYLLMFPLVLLQAKAVRKAPEESRFLLQHMRVSISSPSSEGGELEFQKELTPPYLSSFH